MNVATLQNGHLHEKALKDSRLQLAEGASSSLVMQKLGNRKVRTCRPGAENQRGEEKRAKRKGGRGLPDLGEEARVGEAGDHGHHLAHGAHLEDVAQLLVQDAQREVALANVLHHILLHVLLWHRILSTPSSNTLQVHHC